MVTIISEEIIIRWEMENSRENISQTQRIKSTPQHSDQIILFLVQRLLSKLNGIAQIIRISDEEQEIPRRKMEVVHEKIVKDLVLQDTTSLPF